VNRYLKWAFIEVANAISMNRRRWPGRHVIRVYEHVRSHLHRPTAHRGTRKLHPHAGEYLFLPVEWQGIGKLAHHQKCKQSRGGDTLGD
jgi:hypothetical protein